MKKHIISLIFILFLTGCTVKYNIEFKDDKVFENFDVVVTEKEPNSIKYLKENDFYAYFNPEMIKYNKTISTDKDITKFNYSYSYNIDDYKNSMALSSCFSGYSIIKEGNYYLISTSDGVKCMTSDYSTIIDELDIVITTNHKLIDTNADEVSNYRYIWHINRENYVDKSIYLKIYQDKYVINYKNSVTNTLLIVLGIFVLVILPIIYIVLKRKKSNNI